MPSAELLQMLRNRPFAPFRIHLADGTTYEIRHPELVLVGTASAIVAFPDPERPGLYRSWEIVDLRHIGRLERIEPATQTS
jgi:hypothetical protein